MGINEMLPPGITPLPTPPNLRPCNSKHTCHPTHPTHPSRIQSTPCSCFSPPLRQLLLPLLLYFLRIPLLHLLLLLLFTFFSPSQHPSTLPIQSPKSPKSQKSSHHPPNRIHPKRLQSSVSHFRPLTSRVLRRRKREPFSLLPSRNGAIDQQILH